MSKRTQFTTITPLPGRISRAVVLDFLHNHAEMIDLNPLVRERHPIDPPKHAAEDEHLCVWYSLTDRISYLPGGLGSSDVTYTCAFHDLPNGVQTHCYAPAGLNIRERWTIGGSMAGDVQEPIELGMGAPATGLFIREDVDMRCNIVMTTFVKRTLKKSHAALVEKLKFKASMATIEAERTVLEKVEDDGNVSPVESLTSSVLESLHSSDGNNSEMSWGKADSISSYSSNTDSTNSTQATRINRSWASGMYGNKPRLIHLSTPDPQSAHVRRHVAPVRTTSSGSMGSRSQTPVSMYDPHLESREWKASVSQQPQQTFPAPLAAQVNRLQQQHASYVPDRGNDAASRPLVLDLTMLPDPLRLRRHNAIKDIIERSGPAALHTSLYWQRDRQEGGEKDEVHILAGQQLPEHAAGHRRSVSQPPLQRGSLQRQYFDLPMQIKVPEQRWQHQHQKEASASHVLLSPRMQVYMSSLPSPSEYPQMSPYSTEEMENPLAETEDESPVLQGTLQGPLMGMPYVPPFIPEIQQR